MNLVDASHLPSLDCDCDKDGREDNACNKITGNCQNCKTGFTGDKCLTCDTNFAPASGNEKCTQCIEGYYGEACDQGKL